ncbi:hypothetical protein HPB49_018188 [Dermacentor silvarum]|uniref:Uncharacterized protein n=1 Tax=Dermacentor silvarum TaxID=543639 RepID=A0ACB8E245_DERSI|nr:hypothetical protein HPB49_018188 [Dermacentor silvarum]
MCGLADSANVVPWPALYEDKNARFGDSKPPVLNWRGVRVNTQRRQRHEIRVLSITTTAKADSSHAAPSHRVAVFMSCCLVRSALRVPVVSVVDGYKREEREHRGYLPALEFAATNWLMTSLKRHTHLTCPALISSVFLTLIISGAIRAKHPDARVTSGVPPRPLPKLGLPRADRAFLLRLLIRCAKTAQGVTRLPGTGISVCQNCTKGSEEALTRILLECAGYIPARDSLIAAYRRLGVSTDSLAAFLFPRGYSSVLKRAFTALLEFFECTNLYTRLQAPFCFYSIYF